jgi:GDPmannose 4,6-dehydratase
MKKALIFGISGQDGSYLARLLLELGYEVIGTSRDAQINELVNLDKLGILARVRVISMALNDSRNVLNILKEVHPDEVYNLAGLTSVALSFEQPAEALESITVGTLNIIEGIRFVDPQIRFYSAGSSECFGITGGGASDENTPFRPLSPYAVAKAAAFWQVANYREAFGLYACSGILFNHESPLRHERFVTQKIVATACRIAAGSKEKLRLGNIAIQRDWGWAPEYVETMWRMLQQEKPDDYVIATGTRHSLQDFVEVSFASVGLNWRDHVLIDPSLLRPTDILEGSGNPDKALKKLGWKAKYVMQDVVRMMVKEQITAIKAL